MKLLCDAIAFCYGPATALKVILEVWKPWFDEMTLIATGTTKEYFSDSPLIDRLIEMDTEEPEGLLELNYRGYDAYLCVCNPTAFSVISPKVPATVFVDFLFWMRTKGGAIEFSSKYYLVERYPGYEQALQRFGSQVPGLKMIPPLIKTSDAIASRPESDQILVNLGGQRSKLTQPGSNSDYPSLIVECLQQAAQMATRRSDYVVTTDAQTAADLERSFGTAGWSFRSLKHDDLIDLLPSVSCVITHPGLYTPFEAIAAHRPTLFLPSSNYTQILQLDNFRQVGLAPAAIDWKDVGVGSVSAGLDEPDGVREVLALIKRAYRDQAVRGALIEEFARWLSCEMPLGDIQWEQTLAGAAFLGDYHPQLVEVAKDLTR